MYIHNIRNYGKKTQTLIRITSARSKKSNASNIWCKFDDKLSISDCSVCQHRLNQTFGCARPKKQEKSPTDSPNKEECEQVVNSNFLEHVAGLEEEFEYEMLMPETTIKSKSNYFEN